MSLPKNFICHLQLLIFPDGKTKAIFTSNNLFFWSCKSFSERLREIYGAQWPKFEMDYKHPSLEKN